MNRQLRNLFRLIRLSARVFQGNHEQGRYHRLVRKKAAGLIQTAHAYNLADEQGRLDERKFLKIQWYMVTHLFMGELFAGLWGRKLTDAEQMRFICLGPVLGLSDILIDDYHFTADKMASLLALHSPDQAATPVEKIFLHYHFALFSHLPPALHREVAAIFTQFHRAQVASLQQFDPAMPLDQLEQVVMDKGGTSVLLCWAVLSPVSAAERAAFYELGGLMQKMNDCVDLYKDGQEGIKTSANVFDNMPAIEANLAAQRDRTFSLLRQLPFDPDRLEEFVFVFHVFVVSVFFKLHEYSAKCGGAFHYPTFLQLPKAKARSQPFSWSSFRFCFRRIVGLF